MFENTFSLDLSSDEMAWLRYTLRVPPLVGMPPSLFPEGTSEEIGYARLQTAAMGLKVRGLVSITPDDKLQIDPVLTAAMGAVAFSEQIAIMTTIYADASVSWTYYLGSELTLAHRLPTEGIHHLALTNRFDECLDMMMQNLALQGVPALGLAETEFPGDAFQEAAERINRQSLDSAYEVFAKQNFDEVVSWQLIQAISEAQVRNTIVILKSEGTGDQRQFVNKNGWALYHAPDGVLCVETPHNNQAHVILRGCSDFELRQALAGALT